MLLFNIPHNNKNSEHYRGKPMEARRQENVEKIVKECFLLLWVGLHNFLLGR
jgi:hypothetical protein